eukprot:1204787-Pyramimonas_sp.AAC.1
MDLGQVSTDLLAQRLCRGGPGGNDDALLRLEPQARQMFSSDKVRCQSFEVPKASKYDAEVLRADRTREWVERECPQRAAQWTPLGDTRGGDEERPQDPIQLEKG